MSNEVASLYVTIEGKDVGLSALLNRVDKELAATATRAKSTTDAQTATLGGKLDGIRDDLKAVNTRLGAVEGAVRELKRNGAFGGG